MTTYEKLNNIYQRELKKIKFYTKTQVNQIKITENCDRRKILDSYNTNSEFKQ